MLTSETVAVAVGDAVAVAVPVPEIVGACDVPTGVREDVDMWLGVAVCDACAESVAVVDDVAERVNDALFDDDALAELDGEPDAVLVPDDVDVSVLVPVPVPLAVLVAEIDAVVVAVMDAVMLEVRVMLVVEVAVAVAWAVADGVPVNARDGHDANSDTAPLESKERHVKLPTVASCE